MNMDSESLTSSSSLLQKAAFIVEIYRFLTGCHAEQQPHIQPLLLFISVAIQI